MSDETASWDQFATLLTQVKELYESQIDTKWLYNIVDQLPVAAGALDQARRFLSEESIFVDDPRGAQTGLDHLETLLEDLRQNLLPVLREKLGISGFRDNFSFKNKDQYVVQHMVAYTFPHNLDRMQELVRELRISFEKLDETSRPAETASLPDELDIPDEESPEDTVDEADQSEDQKEEDG